MPAQTVIKVRRDTAANWISTDPTLASGEIGFETDTNQLKIGNGSSAWTALDYTSGGASVEISETAPASPDEGNVWFNSTDGRAYIYYDSTWVDLNPGIAGPIGPAGVVPSTTAPSNTSVLWLDTDETPDVPVPAGGTDGQVLKKTSSTDYATAWENTVIQSATAPADTSAIWYNTEDGNAYVYYDSFWVSISGLPSGVPAGGTTGQVLAKSNSTDYATQWVAPSALTLLNTTSFTAESSVMVNNVFSSTYDFYQVYIQLIGSSLQDLRMRLAAGGTAATGSNYFRQRNLVYSSTIFEASQTTETSYMIGSYGTSNNFLYKLDLANPGQAKETGLMGWGGRADTILFQVGSHTLATAYDGFNLFAPSGTITGSLSIYGLRK